MAAGGQQQQGDNSLAALWITLGLFIFAAVLWYTAHPYITTGIFYIKLLELNLVEWFTSSSYFQANYANLQAWMISVDPSSVTFEQLASAVNVAGEPLKFPLAGVCVILSVFLMFANKKERFKTIYNMNTLLHAERGNYPKITPVDKLNLIEQDINKGPWAMGDSPMIFAKKHNLLVEHQPKADINMIGTPPVTVSLNFGATNREFALQLGPTWEGIDKLNMHTKALLACFAAKANQDREAPFQILDKISLSTASGKLNFDGVEELLKKHRDTKIMKHITEHHAYVYTVLASMLDAARMDGVFATSDFLWLKPVDRTLWYVLNSVGRQTPFSEVAGVYAHWISERMLGRRLRIPVVYEATKALDAAIKEQVYKPDEEEE